MLLSLFIRIQAAKTSMKPGKDTDPLVRPDLTEYQSVLGKLNWLQSTTQLHISYHFSRCASASANATILYAIELSKVVGLVKAKPQRLLYAPIKGVLDSSDSQMQPTRTTQMAPHSVASAYSSASPVARRETPRGR